MKKYILSLMSVVTLFAMTSCNDEEFGSNIVQPGSLISFSIDQPRTRTVYESGDQLQIDWLKGDGITIFCQQAEGAKSADYTITPTSDAEHKNKVETPSKYGLVDYNANGLCWNGAIINENPDHNFYAAYPAGVANAVQAENQLSFPLPNSQECKVSGGLQSAQNYQYVAAPDMRYAYMVAAKEGVKAGDIKSSTTDATGTINLVFAPVMTTLDVVVTYGDDNANVDPLKVTGITVTLPGVPRISGNRFRYQLKENTMSTDEEGDKSSLVTGDLTTSTETFFAGVNMVEVVNGEVKTVGNELALQKGQSVKFTVLLPPVSAANMAKAKIRVNASGSVNYTVTLTGTNIEPSSRRQVNLPAIETPANPKPNNWISQLDDNIYVNQLSIPGTNNSAAFKSFGSVASSQGLDHTLTRQWNDGVRAFEFRTSVADYYFGTIHGGSEVECYDSGVNLNLSFDEAMTEITGLLAASPGEFAIVIVGFQSQQYSDGGWLTGALSYVNRQGKSVWQRRDYSGLSTLGRTYHGMPYFTDKWKDWFVDFDPAMTIKDARKHIILINYDQYGQNESGFVMPGVFIPGAETANSASVDFGSKGWFDITYKGNADTVNKMFIQAMNGQTYGDTDGDKHGAKQAGIFEADAEAVKLHTVTDDSHNWVINYVGGSSATSTADYTADAAVNNKMFNEWMIGNTINGKTRPEGPTGIVMVSHQGVATYNSTPVYGENLPQTIINNNFKFRMQRKGDTTEGQHTGQH